MINPKALALCTLILAGAAPAAAQSQFDGEYYEYWGSIAFSPRTGEYGIASRADTKREANARALDDCRASGARDCQVGPSFKQACGAVARGPKGWGSAASSDGAGAAEDRALNACDRQSVDCEIVVTYCSDGG